MEKNTNSNRWGAVKAVLQGDFKALNAYVRRNTQRQQPKCLVGEVENEDKFKSKAKRRKTIK